MKCILSSESIKVFGKAVHGLSRFGTELYMEDSEDGLSLKSVNSSRSCFGVISFARCFFHDYDSQVDAAQEKNRMTCKVSMKSALTIFKHPYILERTTEKCQITFDPDNDTKVVIELFCQHDLLKSYELFCIESEKLGAIYLKNECSNVLTGSYRLFVDAVKVFQSNESDITLGVTATTLKINNYNEEDTDKAQQFYSEITLEKNEFLSFDVKKEIDVTFSLKELKAALSFAEIDQLPIGVYFSGPGRPIVVSMESAPTVSADFVFATMDHGRPTPALDSEYDERSVRNPAANDSAVTAACKAAAAIRERRNERITTNASTRDEAGVAGPSSAHISLLTQSRPSAHISLPTQSGPSAMSLLNDDDLEPSIWDDIDWPDDIIPAATNKTTVAPVKPGLSMVVKPVSTKPVQPAPTMAVQATQAAVDKQKSKNGADFSYDDQSSQNLSENVSKKYKSILSKSTTVSAKINESRVLAEDTDDDDDYDSDM